MRQVLINPEWPGKVVGAAVFLLAVYKLYYWLIVDVMPGDALVDKAPALLMFPVVIIIALGSALLVWECTTRLIARLEFSDDEYRRFVEFRSWSI